MGRGDLHLGVLLENMRREGFEFAVTPPEIITIVDEKTGAKMEPMEKVSIEVHPEYGSMIIEKMSNRKATYEDCIDMGKER